VLIQKGEVRRPRIGVLVRSEELAAGARAVKVLRVEAGTPAERAGLRAGDLLLRANGDETTTLDDLQRALALGGTAELRLDVRRGDASRSLLVRPETQRAA
jgi:S1-C subfamily serine protease